MRSRWAHRDSRFHPGQPPLPAEAWPQLAGTAPSSPDSVTVTSTMSTSNPPRAKIRRRTASSCRVTRGRALSRGSQSHLGFGRRQEGRAIVGAASPRSAMCATRRRVTIGTA